MQAVRRQAINSMPSNYAGAHSVLVLDAEIEGVVDTGDDTRFLGSVWNSRCWTYQESVLGGRLFFKISSKRKEALTRDTQLLPNVELGSSGLRWLLWRWSHSPFLSLAQSIAWAHSAAPVTQVFVLSLAISCGPQAWYRCTRAVQEFQFNANRSRTCALALPGSWAPLGPSFCVFRDPSFCYSSFG